MFIVEIFKALFTKEEKPKELEHGANWASPYGAKPLYSADKALQAYGSHGYTHAAATRQAQDLASLPIKIMRGDEEVRDHPLNDLFIQPSSQIDGYLFREQLCIDLTLSGNCFVICLGPTDVPTSIMRLHPQEVEIITDELGVTGYKWTSGGKTVVYPPERVIHGRTASYAKGPAGQYGTGVVQVLAAEIDADQNAMLLASQASAKGRPDLILSPTDPADIWGMERRREVIEQYKGMATQGGVLALSGGVDIHPLKVSPREMEYEKSRVFARQSISAVIGVPPTQLGLPSANYALARQEAINYWSSLQKGRGRRFEHIFSMIAKKFDPNLYIIFDYTDIEALQAVRNEQLARIQQHIINGMTPKDAYIYEGLADAPLDDDAVAETPTDLVEYEDPDELEEMDDEEVENYFQLFPEGSKKKV